MYKYMHKGVRALAALAIIGASSQALAATYTDYSRDATVVKKVFKLSGDFGNCGGSGNPDTELRVFTTQDLGGGVTKEIQTRRRYVGGLGGELCVTFKVTFIKSATMNLLVQRQKYNKVGTLVENLTAGYTANCTDCGILLGTSTMTPGIEWASAEQWEEKVGGSSGIVGSKMVLLSTGDDEIINEGTPREEILTNCMTTWEERSTAGPWGNRDTFRVACQNMGLVVAGQVDDTSGTPVERLWQLKSYVVVP